MGQRAKTKSCHVKAKAYIQPFQAPVQLRPEVNLATYKQIDLSSFDSKQRFYYCLSSSTNTQYTFGLIFYFAKMASQHQNKKTPAGFSED